MREERVKGERGGSGRRWAGEEWLQEGRHIYCFVPSTQHQVWHIVGANKQSVCGINIYGGPARPPALYTFYPS